MELEPPELFPEPLDAPLPEEPVKLPLLPLEEPVKLPLLPLEEPVKLPLLPLEEPVKLPLLPLLPLELEVRD